MLLVVTAEVVHQTAHSHSISLELRAPRELLRRQSSNEGNGLVAGLCESCKDPRDIGQGVIAFLGEPFTVDRCKQRIGLLQDAPESHAIAVNFDVFDVANLFDRCEWFARYAVPR